MPDYRYIIMNEGEEDAESTAASTATVPTKPAKPPQLTSAASNTFAAGAGRRAGDQIAQLALSPLNSATGGLASPAYQLGKSALSGGGAGAIGGAAVGVAIAAVNLAIRKIQERMAKIEAEAQQANNRDNLLMRAGVVSGATHYEGTLRGVRKMNRG